MRELDLEVAFVVPRERTLTSLPFHWVRTYSVNRPETHFVELALRRHTPHVESQSLATFDSSDTEVKPGVIVAFGCVGQGIARHVTGEGIGRSVFGCIASSKVTRVKLARYNDSTWQVESVLLRLALIDKDVTYEFKWLFGTSHFTAFFSLYLPLLFLVCVDIWDDSCFSFLFVFLLLV